MAKAKAPCGGESRVCVKNLPAYVTEDKLKEYFSAKGQVTDVKLMRTRDGKSRRFGFVGFHTKEEARSAVSYFDKSFLDTCRLTCEMARALGDSDVLRPWSRHSKGSSAYQRTHPSSGCAQNILADKTHKPEVAPVEADPGLVEFLGVMQSRSKSKLWADDAVPGAHRAQSECHDEALSDKQYLKGKVREHWSDDSDEEEQDKKETNLVVPAEENVSETGRLFVRNLAYSTSEEELATLFGQYGELSQVHLALDKETNRSKGFGYVLFMLPEAAVRAMKELDKSIFQGRLLHVLPAKQAPSRQANEKESMNLKQAREAERKKNEASGNTQAWNSLYVRPDTVAENVAKQYGISKRDFLDPEAEDLAVRLALGETHVIAETKRTLSQEGVNVELLEAVVSSNKEEKVLRSNVVVLAKNLPFSTTEAELSNLFGAYGSLGRLILPPSRTIAIVEFLEASEARKAFEHLSYRRFKHVPLYLEWAPRDLLSAKESAQVKVVSSSGDQLLGGFDLTQDVDLARTRCVFVKNLNFRTTEADLKKHFEQQMRKGSLRKVTIKRKPSKTGEALLSMGFGFVEFDCVETATRICEEMQGSVLDGHALILQLSCGDDNLRKSDATKKHVKGSSTKIIVRNVAFEATRKDLKQLFSPFGEMKKLKLPKKFDGNHRGFAFVDFVTKQEAENAYNALANTHLYGRHLVLEWAREDESLEELRARTAAQVEPNNKKRKMFHET